MAVYRVDEMFDDQPTDTPYYAGDSILLGEDDELWNTIERMGIPIEVAERAELMGGPIKRLIKRIRKRIRKRRARRAKKKALAELGPEQPVSQVPQFAFSTPRGGVTYGPGGMNITYPQAGPGSVPVSVAPQQQQVARAGMANPLEFIQKNPMLLAIPVGIFAMSMLMQKRRRGNGNGNGKK